MEKNKEKYVCGFCGKQKYSVRGLVLFTTRKSCEDCAYQFDKEIEEACDKVRNIWNTKPIAKKKNKRHA